MESPELLNNWPIKICPACVLQPAQQGMFPQQGSAFPSQPFQPQQPAQPADPFGPVPGSQVQQIT